MKTMHPAKQLYLIHGGELQQTIDAIAQIYSKLADSYLTKHKLHLSAQFNWQQLLKLQQDIGLFSDTTVIELYIKDGKLGKSGSQFLINFLEQQKPHLCLIIIADKLEKAILNSKWFKAIAAKGTIVNAAPLNRNATIAWAKKQAQLQELQLSANTIAQIVDYNQELNNIKQLFYKLEVARVYDPKQITQFANDNKQFSIFALVDAALVADVKQTIIILTGIQKQQIEPILILWAITREVRNILNIATAMQNGATLNDAAAKNQVWGYKLPIITKALQKLSLPQLTAIHRQLAVVDAITKGVVKYDKWLAIENICLQLASNRNINLKEIAYASN